MTVSVCGTNWCFSLSPFLSLKDKWIKSIYKGQDKLSGQLSKPGKEPDNLTKTEEIKSQW